MILYSLDILFHVDIGEVSEVAPTGQMFLGIGHFVHRKVLHGRDILFDFAIFEVRNGDLSKVNNEESLDLVPVFNVFFSLVNREKKILLLFSLRFGALKHGFDAHFVLVYFVD